MGTWVLMLTEAYGLMKTGRTESEEPGVVPMPELGLDTDEVDESIGMAPDQIDRRWGRHGQGSGAA